MGDDTGSPNVGGELLRSIYSRDLGPVGLIDADAVKDSRKLVTILGCVDFLGVSPKHLHTAMLQPQGDILGQLSWDNKEVSTMTRLQSLANLRR